VFENYGRTTKPYVSGSWELDHVIQRKKGGASKAENYLPACGKCNHLRWHRGGEELRELIWLGLVAQGEIKKKTALGRALEEKSAARLAQNRKRRANR
jgi:5-methylcytosine-specific restriction endonuclease McrA